MNLGLDLGYLKKGSPDPVALAVRAEAVGFDSVWVSEAWGSDDDPAYSPKNLFHMLLNGC